MTGTYRFDRRLGRSSWSAPLAGLLCAVFLGCGSLLDVENPNNIKGEDIELPEAGTALANGALARVAHGVVGASLPYQVATDEMAWKGSRDGWRELDQGKLSNAFNEFVDGSVGAGFPNLAAARWLADEAIRVLEEQQTAGTIVNVLDLARANLYAAIAYVSIANMFDDYAFSDRRLSEAPVGTANMGSMYDTAIGYLTTAFGIASGRDAALANTIRAMRARANFDRAIWETVNPPRAGAGMVNPASSYVANAVSDATAVLATTFASFQFVFDPTTGSSVQGSEVNSRQENRIGGTYVRLHPTDPTWYTDSTLLMDPIDNIPQPFVHATQSGFKAAGLYPRYTVVSNREMYLILAEAALAGSDLVGFTTAINDLRALDALTDYSGQVAALTLLQHSRQANLFLQSRRLSDHYRFNVASPEWQPGSQALTTPGTFLPISARECLSNSFIGPANCSS